MSERDDLSVEVNHYIGIDVGTGSARACIMNDHGDIVGLHSEVIGLWQPQTGYYVSPRRLERRPLGMQCSKSDRSRNNRRRTSGAVSAPRSEQR